MDQASAVPNMPQTNPGKRTLSKTSSGKTIQESYDMKSTSTSMAASPRPATYRLTNYSRSTRRARHGVFVRTGSMLGNEVALSLACVSSQTPLRSQSRKW